MNKQLTHGSLFSGVGGFDMGAELAGIETKWQCEIDKNPTKVLEKHWPTVKRYTDVCQVKGNEIEPVDIISFGSPCQDLSIAGKRAGLEGARSGLYHETIRIAKEMRDATNNQYPRFLIWENVRGALSSNAGRDFNTAIQEMAKLGAMDISYRLVNACRFGVPQRRVRVFVVADLDGFCAGKILTESESLLWHPPQIGEQGQEVTNKIGESTKSKSQETTTKIVGTLAARDYKGVGNQYVQENKLIIQSYAISGNVIGRQDENGPNGISVKEEGEPMYTLTSTDHHAVGIVDKPQSHVLVTRQGKPGGGKGALVKDEMSLTLSTANTQTLITKKNKPKYQVRRLTPTECERLMGWPDDHTRYDKEGNELSDSARYKMIGNGIVSPVAQWVCQNIVNALREEQKN